MEIYLRNQLLNWNDSFNKRSMPWKGEKDAYKIWLSEIILQQTRVNQGEQYYLNFIEKYPTIQSLANAPVTEVYKTWEGLGYYSRCKNLHITAQIICEKYGGKFPNNYDELLKLIGIGPYTAAAIASFAFNLPYPVLDGNVYRILARYFGIDLNIDTVQAKKIFYLKASKLIDKENPAIFNQAIMDFGATVCKPQLPTCTTCVLQKKCVAFAQSKVEFYPVKSKAKPKIKRYFNYFIFHYKDKIFLQKRTKNDIWQYLYEFYLLEEKFLKVWDEKMIQDYLTKKLNTDKFTIKKIVPNNSQLLTHQQIITCFIEVDLKIKSSILIKGEWVLKNDLTTYSFAKTCRDYIMQINEEDSLINSF